MKGMQYCGWKLTSLFSTISNYLELLKLNCKKYNNVISKLRMNLIKSGRYIESCLDDNVDTVKRSNLIIIKIILNFPTPMRDWKTIIL